MRRRTLLYSLIGGIVALSIIGLLLLPTILRAIPSRYVALMPEPIQQLGVRTHVEALPTAAVSATIDTNALLNVTQIAVVSPTTVPSPVPINSPTPLSTAVLESGPTAVPTSAATATPRPPTPTLTPTPIPFDSSVRLQSVQHQFQAWNNCGPATLAMGLSHFDLYLRQEQTADWLKPNPEDRNVTPQELVEYVELETDLNAITRVNGDLDQVRQYLTQDIPIIIETGIDPPGEYRWLEWYGHYLLVVAYDDVEETFWVYDSWLGSGVNEEQERIATAEGRPISYDEFDQYWRQFNRTYVAIYSDNQADMVDMIIGPDLDDGVMWQQTLAQNAFEIEQEPDNAYLWFNLGNSYLALGEYEKAAQAFDQARQIGLPWRMLWYQFGPYQAYYETGRYQDVIELADTTLFQRPYFEESYYYRGIAALALGDERAARNDLNAAVAFNPRFEPAAQALADLDS